MSKAQVSAFQSPVESDFRSIIQHPEKEDEQRFLKIHRQSHQRALKTCKSGNAKEKSDDKQTFTVDDDLLLFIKLNLLAYTLSLPCCACFLQNKPLMHQVMTSCLSRTKHSAKLKVHDEQAWHPFKGFTLAFLLIYRKRLATPPWLNQLQHNCRRWSKSC